MTTHMFVLTAAKRAAKLIGGAWESDEAGFARRWPNGKSPDIGVRRSTDASVLIEQAFRYNEAQIQSGYLDWLYSVDIDTPIHPECNASCPTRKGRS